MKPRFRIEIAAPDCALHVKERRRNFLGLPYYKSIAWFGVYTNEINALNAAGRYLDCYVEIDAKHNRNANGTKLP